MHEPKSKTYPYKECLLICGAQVMEDQNYSASLMVAEQIGAQTVETVVQLSPTPFADPEMAIAHALLHGRHWVDNRT